MLGCAAGKRERTRCAPYGSSISGLPGLGWGASGTSGAGMVAGAGASGLGASGVVGSMGMRGALSGWWRDDLYCSPSGMGRAKAIRRLKQPPGDPEPPVGDPGLGACRHEERRYEAVGLASARDAGPAIRQVGPLTRRPKRSSAQAK
jgi:hypothetical protein